MLCPFHANWLTCTSCTTYPSPFDPGDPYTPSQGAFVGALPTRGLSLARTMIMPAVEQELAREIFMPGSVGVVHRRLAPVVVKLFRKPVFRTLRKQVCHLCRRRAIIVTFRTIPKDVGLFLPTFADIHVRLVNRAKELAVHAIVFVPSLRREPVELCNLCGHFLNSFFSASEPSDI